jgi:PKD repeat protein
MWGLSPTDDNTQINAYKTEYGITNPCAGTEGGGPAAIDITIDGQTFLGYPTYCVVCPDKTLYFDVCYPPEVPCFDPFFQQCSQHTLIAGFTADITEICEGGLVHFSDQSIGNILEWDWTFEGGEPVSSNEQNPVVTYSSAGQWDVTLSVSSVLNTNTSTIEDYIKVWALPDVLLGPFEDVCLQDAPFQLSGGIPEGGSYSGPGVEDGWFYPELAGLGVHTIIYSYTDNYGCTNNAGQTILVDPCSGIDGLESLLISIYPNPSDGIFNLKIKHNGQVSVEITNVMGVVVYSVDVLTSGEYSTTIVLKELTKGLYFIRAKTDEGLYIRKIYTF